MLDVIHPLLVGTKVMAADMLTKALGAVAFYLYRDNALNMNNAPSSSVVLRGYSARLWRRLVDTTRPAH